MYFAGAAQLDTSVLSLLVIQSREPERMAGKRRHAVSSVTITACS